MIAQATRTRPGLRYKHARSPSAPPPGCLAKPTRTHRLTGRMPGWRRGPRWLHTRPWLLAGRCGAPGKTALRFEGRCVSYAELARAVRRVAAWLGGSGVSRGDRVAYLGPNCPELLELLYACARIGAIFVPLNARMPAAELGVFLAVTRPRPRPPRASRA